MLAQIEMTNAQSVAVTDGAPRSWYRCPFCGWIHLSPAPPRDDTLEAGGVEG